MAVPDYMTDRDAVLKDDNVHWRHKVAPSYKKSRDFFDQSTLFSPLGFLCLCDDPLLT